MKRLLILILILNLLPACLPFQLPSEHGEAIDKLPSQIVIGSTTKEEIIKILGQPEYTRDRFILYKKKYSRVMIVLLPFPIYKESRVRRFMDLYFRFDDYGVLTDYRTDKYDQHLRALKEYPKTREPCDSGMESCP